MHIYFFPRTLLKNSVSKKLAAYVTQSLGWWRMISALKIWKVVDIICLILKKKLNGYYLIYTVPGVDRSGVICIKYPGDKLASLTFSNQTHFGFNRMTIRGTKGLIMVSDVLNAYRNMSCIYINHTRQIVLENRVLPPKKSKKWDKIGPQCVF